MDRAQLQAVIDALPDPVIALDRDAAVLSVNRAAGAIAATLWSAEARPRRFASPALVETIDRAVTSRRTERVEFSEGTRDERWYRAHVIPTASCEATDAPALFLVTLHDLTPLRRVEEVRADFVANASHELRTPLAALAGFIDTLQGPARDDPAARDQFLDIMQAQARRMARLIDDLLSLSRIELSEHIEPDAPTALQPVVRHVVDSMQTLARERRIKVSLAAPRRALLVLGDRDELVRVFENLVENALKYGAAGKRVDLRIKRSRAPAGGKAEAVVSVRDYGVGIEAEHLPRLTERFYRVDVGVSRSEGGTGLGLALVKHIVNRHRGRLAIDSTPGAGSTFSVHLPLANGAQAPGSGARPRSRHARP